MSETKLHQPVLLTEVIEGLAIRPGQWYLDATFGRGGHTQQLLKLGAKVIALDFDQEAIAYGQKNMANEIAQGRLILIRENFAHLADLKAIISSGQLAGALFDFGTTQDQLKSPQRGFSFSQPDSELDMRMDDRLGVTAKDLVNALPAKQLAQLFYDWGGEHQSRAIAQAIVHWRQDHPGEQLTTVGELTTLIDQVKGGATHFSKLNPATKVFQALRIAVNDELTNIEQGLTQVLSLLTPPARVVTISFHEGEDRLAKNIIKEWHYQQLGQILTKKPLTPSFEEIRRNPAARSAKLRIFSYENQSPTH